MKTNCAYCNKELNRRPCLIKKGNSYCNSSHQLSYEYENGIRNKKKITEKAIIARRKQGLERFNKKPRTYISKRGYLMIYIPCRGDVKYHHYVWEKKFEKVPKGYHLHHINLNKLDNRIKNLQLLSAKEHGELHGRLRKRNREGLFIEKKEEEEDQGEE